MSTTRITSREFNQDVTRAKRAAAQGPVYITDRGRPAHVLLTIEAYEALKAGENVRISEFLSLPEAAGIEFEVPKLQRHLFDVAEFE